MQELNEMGAIGFGGKSGCSNLDSERGIYIRFDLDPNFENRIHRWTICSFSVFFLY